MFRINFTIFLLLLATLCRAQMQGADKIIGEWMSEEKDSRIEIYKSGSTYSGKLLWATELLEADGKTMRKDIQNREESLQDRSLQDANILTDFVYNEGTWENGKMYDPQSGKTYNCIIRLRNELLEVRSYIGFPLLGRSTYWKRAAPAL